MTTKTTLLTMILSASLLCGAQALAGDGSVADQARDREQSQESQQSGSNDAASLQVCFDHPQQFQRKPSDYTRPGKFEPRL